jgi:hypothetical protein
MTDFRDQSEVMTFFLKNKNPFLEGVRSEDNDGIFFIECIRREMYRELMRGLKCIIDKHGNNINTGEDFTINLTWTNNVAKMIEFRFEIDFDESFIELGPVDNPVRIIVNDFKYGQAISRSWTFKAIKDSLVEDKFMPGFYSLDGQNVATAAFGQAKSGGDPVDLFSLKNIFYQFDTMDAMNFLFSFPAQEVLEGTKENILTEVIQPEDGPD